MALPLRGAGMGMLPLVACGVSCRVRMRAFGRVLRLHPKGRRVAVPGTLGSPASAWNLVIITDAAELGGIRDWSRLGAAPDDRTRKGSANHN
ncbi:hypothetical protein ARTHRO8AJ_10102 [Arthrobacter sp. 8AJ]|nr:hypothetical protein ARTHRO8AJ_10102 [Arthrobacter sp. 8AJ]